MTVFSNTTPLFAFVALKKFDLLREIHGPLFVAESVINECEIGGSIQVPALRSLSWIHVVAQPAIPDSRFLMLDAGERDTISAALDFRAELVLLDERMGRNLAESHGLRVVGTLGTLLKAKKIGLIPAFLPLTRRLQAAGFWYHEPLVRRLAALVDETT